MLNVKIVQYKQRYRNKQVTENSSYKSLTGSDHDNAKQMSSQVAMEIVAHNSQTKHVLDDLVAIETQLEYLSRLSPDDDRPLYKGMTATTTIVGLEETPTTPTKIPFKRSDAFKCLLLTRLPSILSIHVQRRYFDPNTGKSSKTMQHISFPEMLDISSFCAYGAPKRHHSSFAGTTYKSS